MSLPTIIALVILVLMGVALLVFIYDTIDKLIQSKKECKFSNEIAEMRQIIFKLYKPTLLGKRIKILNGPYRNKILMVIHENYWRIEIVPEPDVYTPVFIDKDSDIIWEIVEEEGK